MNLAFAALAVAALVLATACAGPEDSDGAPATQQTPEGTILSTAGPTSSPEPTTSGDEVGPDTPAPTPTVPRGPSDDPDGGTITSPGAVPPEIFNSIIADLVDRTGAHPSQFDVVRSEEVVWSDGSLGCLKPREFYTQALVEGYWVVLDYRGQQFDYRVNSQGAFFLCEGALLPRPGVPGGEAPGNPAQ